MSDGPWHRRHWVAMDVAAAICFMLIDTGATLAGSSWWPVHPGTLAWVMLCLQAAACLSLALRRRAPLAVVAALGAFTLTVTLLIWPAGALTSAHAGNVWAPYATTLAAYGLFFSPRNRWTTGMPLKLRPVFEKSIFELSWSLDRRQSLVDLGDVTDVACMALIESERHAGDVPVRPGRQQGFPLRIRFALILRRIGVVIAARLGPFGIELAGSGLDVLAGEPPHVVTPWVSHPAVIGTPHVAGAPGTHLMASAQRLMGTCGGATPGANRTGSATEALEGGDAGAVDERAGRAPAAAGGQVDDRVRSFLHRLRAVVPVEIGRGVAGVGRVDAHLRERPGVLHREHRDGGLRRRVERRVDLRLDPPGIVHGGKRAQATGHVDDGRGARCAEDGHEGAGHADDAHDVGAVDGQGVLCGQFRGLAVGTGNAGVVDQDVEAARGRDRLGGARDGRVARHVELHEPAAEGVRRLLTARRVARAHPHGVPGLDEAAGGFIAEALVGAGDQCCCHAPSLRRPRRMIQARVTTGTGSTTQDPAVAVRLGLCRIRRVTSERSSARGATASRPSTWGFPPAIRGGRRACGVRNSPRWPM